MRIGIVGPVYPYRGGIAHHTTLLARALSERHEVQVVSFQRLYPRWLYPGASDRDPSKSPLHITADYLLDSLKPWTWWQAVKLLLHLEPDLVIIPWWTTFLALMTASLVTALQRSRVRVGVLIHNVLPHEPRPWDTWLTRWALGKVQLFVTQTEQEKARLLALFPDVTVMVISHPVYDMFAGQTIPQLVARQHLNLPVDVPLALFFGIVRPYKGLKYLLEAMAYIRDQGVCFHLVVAGEFWENRSGYDSQIQALNLTDRVHIFPHYIPNEDVGTIFSAVDILVAPYIATTQSGVIKLAFGVGLPVLTTWASEDCDLEPWVTTGRVRLVAPRNAKALAEALLSGPPLVRDQSGHDQSNDMTSSYTWASWVVALEKLVSTHI